jgi:hypothetical protein
MSDETPLPYPLPLLIAHAPKADRPWHALCWRIDDLMARTVLGAREGAVAAIRLAWWEEALTAPGPRQGEPLLAQWQAFDPGDDARAAINAIAGAWRMLLDPAPMSTAEWLEFGKGRGALFPLIARRPGDAPLENAGASWALWDAANRDADRQRAEGAFAAAGTMKDAAALDPAAMRSKPLALAAAMAADDIKAGRLPDGHFTPRQYLRLLRRAPFF